MPDQLQLFHDPPAPPPGEIAKERGIHQALDNKRSLVAHVREWMKELGRVKRFVTADDVQQLIADRGISIYAMGNAMGGIFRDGNWRATGRYVKSVREHAHSNRILVWEFIGK